MGSCTDSDARTHGCPSRWPLERASYLRANEREAAERRRTWPCQLSMHPLSSFDYRTRCISHHAISVRLAHIVQLAGVVAAIGKRQRMDGACSQSQREATETTQRRAESALRHWQQHTHSLRTSSLAPQTVVSQ